MITDKSTARIVGVLYIIGTMASVASAIVMGSFSNSSDLLNLINANPHRVEFGALLMLVMGLPLAGSCSSSWVGNMRIQDLLIPLSFKFSEI